LEDEVDFGAVQVGTTGWFDLDLALVSGGPAETTFRLAPEGGAYFLAELPSPVLSDGEAQTLQIGFNPSEMGAQIAALVIEADNVEGVSIREVVLRGTGVAGPLDLDRDGVPEGEDCDDSSPSVYPGAAELCDGLDTDCDPSTHAPGGESDGDGDGWFGCSGDCDDSVPSIHPEADEICDGVDNDCDGVVAEDDIDGDGFLGCSDDCDDADPAIYPGATEICDGFDNNCDNLIPEDEQDGDGDGVAACEGDCVGDDFSIHPGATELCDGIDNDCDPSTESAGGEGDSDSDGALACADCDDSVATIFPGAPELCDGIDNDCDTLVPDTETDDDGDSFTECSGEDCDDTDPAINIAAIEECFDGVDDDCDGVVNQGCSCPIWAWNQANSTCTSFGTYDCPHPTIAGALAAEASEPTCAQIWLRPGTYTEAVTLEGVRDLRGPGDPSEVVLDGVGSNRVLLVEEDAQVQLSSMTVTGGFASEGGGLKALDNSFVSVLDMVFVGNDCAAAGSGGAIAFFSAEFEVVDSVFEGNDCGWGGADAGNDGGAISSEASLGLIQGNLFDGNTAGDASDLFVRNSAGPVVIVQNSFLDGSTADSSSEPSEWMGGAVLIGSNHVLLANNLFGGHSAAEGSSGLFVAWASSFTEVVNNLFIYGASPDGGAIQFGQSVQFYSPAVVINNIVVENVGWGVYSGYAGQPSGLSHNDVWNNSLGLYMSTAILQPPPLYSLSVDPSFVAASDDGDWSNDDFTLSSGSWCIDMGRYSPVWLDDNGTVADLGIFGGPYAGWTPPVP